MVKKDYETPEILLSQYRAAIDMMDGCNHPIMQKTGAAMASLLEDQWPFLMCYSIYVLPAPPEEPTWKQLQNKLGKIRSQLRSSSITLMSEQKRVDQMKKDLESGLEDFKDSKREYERLTSIAEELDAKATLAFQPYLEGAIDDNGPAEADIKFWTKTQQGVKQTHREVAEVVEGIEPSDASMAGGPGGDEKRPAPSIASAQTVQPPTKSQQDDA